MSKAEDRDILIFAIAENAVVVTLDADFHAILAVSGAAEPSVVRLRMQGLDAAAVLEIVKRAVMSYPRELASGCLVTVKPNKTTCHRLPIGGAGSDPEQT